MSLLSHPQLAEHLQRHARKLHRIACGLGRERDADDLIQTLYARWWRRMMGDPAWSPPEASAELFVCVKRVVMDVVAKEKRDRLRHDRGGSGSATLADSPEDALHAFERLQWILAHLPAPLAEVLEASLSAGRRNDAAVARELGLTVSAFTGRLFKARRAAEELCVYYELLGPGPADLMAALGYGGKTRAQVAHDHGMLLDELETQVARAAEVLERSRKAAAS